MWDEKVGLRALDEIASVGAADAFLAHARERAQAGNADWQFFLGYLALHREGPSIDEARAWLERAASQGHADALYALAIATVSERSGRLSLGQPVNREGWTAVERAARAGSVDAQRMLACALAGGEDGLPRDPAAARAWHEQAAEQGLRISQYDVGMMWLDGEGGPVGTERGLGWLEMAAAGSVMDLGAFSALEALASLYEKGDLGVPRNGSRAGRYRKLALWAGQAREQREAHERSRRPQVRSVRLLERTLSLFPLEDPPERVIVHACDECDRLRDDLLGRAWFELDAGIVELHKDSIPLLSPEAFAYYLPAFAVEALRDPVGEVAGIAVPSIGADFARANRGALSPEQGALIGEIIELVGSQG